MKRHLYVFAIVFTVLAISVFPLSAEKNTNPDPSQLTLERIFTSQEFTPKRFGPARWLKHKTGYTTLEDSATKGTDIIRYDPKSGNRTIEVPASDLIPKGKKAPLAIDDYQWSNDGSRLLIFTNTKKVWRQNTRGDYWILNLKNKNLWQLGGDAEESTLMFTKFSPDSTRVAYVQKNNIYVQHLGPKPGDRRITQLTSDGSKTIINGTFDWVYEEEFGLRDGFRWSPDGKHIAYWQLDAEGVRDFYLINNTDSLYPKITPVQYPKVGTTNSSSKVGVISVSGGKTLWFEVPGDPRNHYIARMDWAANSSEIVFQRLNRLQNTKKVMLGNIGTGNVKTILTEQGKAWVEVDDNLQWLDNGKHFSWVSERDGWRHVYVVSRSGEKLKLVTPGEYDVIRVLKIDGKTGWLYYIASPDNPAQRYLYRTRLNGKGKARRLTPMNRPGTHGYQLSSDLRWAIHTYSAFLKPPHIQVVRLPDHKQVRVLEDNREVQARIDALRKKPVEFFRVDIGDNVLLDGWCLKPPDFDPNKRYPLLIFVYGEPANQTVLDVWGRDRRRWHMFLSQQGYIVISVDNRGTPAPRSREWRKSIYRQIGILASADQAAAARAIIKNRPYIDPQRIGIWGWSGGGSMTLNALFRYPELYHTGISVAPITNQLFYDTIYQERYMGLPDDNKEGYKNGSPITFAHRLKGNLLLIHGTGDDNVHYQSSETLINKLIELNKPFSMMSYPNRTHGLTEGKTTHRHLYELMTRFLKQNLPPGGKK
ncbi:MAG: S9 family peptidase [bacterium]|nr:S9 family peptidase [bacterium]